MGTLTLVTLVLGLALLLALALFLGRLQADLARLCRAHEDLRLEARRARESTQRELAQAAQGIRGELGTAQRALAEMRALEGVRARQIERSADSLRRLEAVLAGSAARGAAGENLLASALSQLPPDLLAVDLAFEGRVVEFALRLPDGRYLPIDSKWTSVPTLTALESAEDPRERRQLLDQLLREVRGRVKEMARYLDPERTLGLGLVAVPDAVHGACPEVHVLAFREGVLLVPYSLALPFVLALYRLAARSGGTLEPQRLASHVEALREGLRRIDEEVEGRLSRGMVLIENARDGLRRHVASARRQAEELAASAHAEHAEPRSFDAPRATG